MRYDMKKFKIIPFHNIYKYNGIASIVEAINKNEAMKLAKEKSGLGRFKNWNFSKCKEIKR